MSGFCRDMSFVVCHSDMCPVLPLSTCQLNYYKEGVFILSFTPGMSHARPWAGLDDVRPIHTKRFAGADEKSMKDV